MSTALWLVVISVYAIGVHLLRLSPSFHVYTFFMVDGWGGRLERGEDTGAGA